MDHLDWPFFGPEHREFAEKLSKFKVIADHHEVDATCRSLVRQMGEAGLLAACVGTGIDSRLVCIAREKLAWTDGLADFAFAMQGLGSGAVALAGSAERRAEVLPKVASGEWLAAFALSESAAGSDVAALQCAAQTDGDSYILDGEKSWISNGGIADVYTVFARTGEAPGARGISAFVVFPDDPGFSIAERIEVMAPHPLATLRFEACRIPATRLLGMPGEGFKIAMRTLDIFRISVGAAALGFARRAFDEAVAHSISRRMFGGRLADLDLAKASLGEMAALIDAAALLVYRAAWQRDVPKLSTTREAAMAKLVATENAQIVIDKAVQLFGGRGVKSGEIVERLYREIRALRIYEGASEVQKLIIARDVLKAAEA